MYFWLDHVVQMHQKQPMEKEDPDQNCPFCYAPWGECAHYELLVALEEEADELGHFIRETDAPKSPPDSPLN